MTEREKAMARAIFISAKVKPGDLDWMIESCPSLEAAREMYPRYAKPTQLTPLPPRHWHLGIMAARDAVLDARRSGDSDRIFEALRMLTIEIVIFQDRIEQEANSMPLPDSCPCEGCEAFARYTQVSSSETK